MTASSFLRILALSFVPAISACAAGSDAPEDWARASSDSSAAAMVPVGTGKKLGEAAPSGAHLTFFGGPVTSHISVAPLYWNSSVQFQSNLNLFYIDVPNSPLFTVVLSQYGVGAGSGRAGVVDARATANVTDSTVRTELLNQINAGRLPAPTANTYYPIHFPPGMSITAPDGTKSCISFCAYHSTFVRNGVNVNYGVIPDQGGNCSACGTDPQLVNNLDAISSCQLTNTATDAALGLATSLGPPLAWFDSSLGEVCSICGGQQSTIAGNGRTYVIDRVFSNAAKNCVPTGDFTIAASPASQTITAGAGAVYSVATAIQSGVAQSVSLSVSGLPSGVSGSFNPVNVTAGGSSTLTLTSLTTTALGTSQFTITGDDALTRHAANASVTVASNQPPAVSITSPLNGSTVSGVVTVTASASDADGVASVRFDLPDGTSITDNSAPFSITWNSTTVLDGNHSITATATDSLGAVSSSSVAVLVNNNDFSLTATPASQTITAGTRATYTISTAVVSGPARTIVLSVSGLPNGITGSFSPASVAAGGSSTLTLTSSLTTGAGTTQFTISGVDAVEPTTHTTNASVTIAANQPPAVTITSPSDGSTVSGLVSVTASASDTDGVASVTFELPDGTSNIVTTAPFSTTWDSTRVPDGSGYLIHAIATDNRGMISVSTATITVSNCVNHTFNATNLPIAIPDNNAIGVTSTINVTGSGTVGSLSLSLNITHPFRGDLIVTLISPAGTSFIVSNREGGSTSNIVVTNLTVSTFNGETAAGNWQLKVQDLSIANVGTLNSWSLTIVGSCAQTAHWSGTATPTLPTIDNGMVCTSLNVSTTGDAALAELDVFGIHDSRSILRGTLTHSGVTVNAFATGTFPSGPGTFSLIDRAVPGLSGDASGAWTLCIFDTDATRDTGVLTAWSVHD